jgi:hypothetical protein
MRKQARGSHRHAKREWKAIQTKIISSQKGNAKIKKKEKNKESSTPSISIIICLLLAFGKAAITQDT